VVSIIILYYIILYYNVTLCYILLYYIILYYIILYYINLMEPPSYMRSIVDRNVVMRRIPVFADRQHCLKHYIYPIQAVSESS